MILTIPTNSISPSLDDMQNAFTKSLNAILETHQYINLWGQGETKKSAMKTGKKAGR